MFADAMEKAAGYVRPVKTIARIYKSDEVIPQAATMFFVNREGAAVTCRHIAEEIMRAGRINARYDSFRKELNSLPADRSIRIETNRMERRFDYLKGETTIQLRYSFADCYEKIERLSIDMHPFRDLAIIRLQGSGGMKYSGNCTFSATQKPRPGMSVCRLGYPVTGFDDYEFFPERDDIQWTVSGAHVPVQIPSDGMIVRTYSEEGRAKGFVLSGLCGAGYCGAPVVNRDGVLMGMVSGTSTEIVDGTPVTYTECISAGVIKEFLQEKKVHYTEI